MHIALFVIMSSSSSERFNNLFERAVSNSLRDFVQFRAKRLSAMSGQKKKKKKESYIGERVRLPFFFLRLVFRPILLRTCLFRELYAVLFGGVGHLA